MSETTLQIGGFTPGLWDQKAFTFVMESNKFAHKDQLIKMVTAHSYLHFNGNCEEVFGFYRSVFGGDYEMVSRYKDAPPQNAQSEKEADKIMHISLPLSPHSMLMGSDIPEAFPKATIGNNYYISLQTESEEEATRIFNGLAAGGNIAMPLDKTFWGAFFGMLIDKYGVQWMVSYNYQQ